MLMMAQYKLLVTPCGVATLVVWVVWACLGEARPVPSLAMKAELMEARQTDDVGGVDGGGVVGGIADGGVTGGGVTAGGEAEEDRGERRSSLTSSRSRSNSTSFRLHLVLFAGGEWTSGEGSVG
jgi:hypothetical protein